ncbi:ECF-type sigma factor [Exilibacterium tricleocarpae]|uniref:ECF-type sigma factor n=1 Tax=Exilibacterium tricleocarpae TaxID=2591008 RepID=UPI0015D444BE|nr:ECF-type sigma factor [Exilibacterium tricleocarpae]
MGAKERAEESWIDGLRAGEKEASEYVWKQYYQKLLTIAGQRLTNSSKVMSDEEDVVVSAFKSFFRAVHENRASELNSEDDIWRLLITLTARKAIKQLRYESRAKRDSKKQHSNDADIIDNLVCPEPSAEFLMMMADEYRELNARLLDDDMRLIVLRKLEGYSNTEVAQLLNINLRTVQRRLIVVRSLVR